MIEMEMPDAAELTAARQRFAELSDSRALLADSGDTMGATISAGRLYAHAMAAQPAPDAVLEAALDNNLSLRRSYRGFLAAVASYRLGEVMAASTEQIPPRRGVGCRIAVELSQAEPDQFIVIVELDAGAKDPAPGVLLLCDRDDRCFRFPLTAPHRGVIQFIVTADDPILPLLRDPRTEALLR
ncbi:MAG: hypothetical protein HOA08_22170 [Rhodospirillaceae bacterium]|jgi:hypothetical protein|nr:hypothetical protein [Rhodospirillaceae bacterium]MBT3491725.1 hypothetical protein [Rhodospirillaceae bacterium]MBT3783219.1 hypothetical protein [Rhodospirillaceae bacterium]MBT3978215.1 hypothetical protein [Rhodospirillaceae bacterium]MBT4169749.1 hypothetical protein [Rhodospirillaceae bacterium]